MPGILLSFVSKDLSANIAMPIVDNISGKRYGGVGASGVVPKTMRIWSRIETKSKTIENITVGVKRLVFVGSSSI
jgi:hypothetical protein